MSVDDIVAETHFRMLVEGNWTIKEMRIGWILPRNE